MTVARPAVGRVPVWFTLASIGPVLRCVALVGVGWGRWCGGEVGGLWWNAVGLGQMVDFLDTYFYESCPCVARAGALVKLRPKVRISNLIGCACAGRSWWIESAASLAATGFELVLPRLVDSKP